MNQLHDFTDFFLRELFTKCQITEEQIGHLDHSLIDLMEDSFEVKFSLKGKAGIYTFWHDYEDEVGKLTHTDHNDNDELIQIWGDWDTYTS